MNDSALVRWHTSFAPLQVSRLIVDLPFGITDHWFCSGRDAAPFPMKSTRSRLLWFASFHFCMCFLFFNCRMTSTLSQSTTGLSVTAHIADDDCCAKSQCQTADDLLPAKPDTGQCGVGDEGMSNWNFSTLKTLYRCETVDAETVVWLNLRKHGGRPHFSPEPISQRK